jgi:hypothetical protein
MSDTTQFPLPPVAAQLPEPKEAIKPQGVMIDIETLSTHPSNAVVLSIGAVKFALRKQRPMFLGPKHFLTVLELHSQIAAGREISAETQKFWREQSPDARKHWTDTPPERVHEGLIALGNFIGDPELPVWANGICFDIGNLDSLYRTFLPDKGVPWKYNSTRDARTVYRALPEVCTIPDGALTTIAHDPVADCYNQIWGLWQHWPQFDE